MNEPKLTLTDSEIHERAPWLPVPYYDVYRAGYEAGILREARAAIRTIKDSLTVPPAAPSPAADR